MTAVLSAESRLIQALKDVEDPEFALSVVDLGLIVDLALVHGRADVKITFTLMGCPAMDMIIDDVRERLLREPEVHEVDIEVVWDPIWTKKRLSDEGKMALRAL